MVAPEWPKTFLSAMLALAATITPTSAQTFTTLVIFNNDNGALPNPLIQGLDGNYYGSTFGGEGLKGGSGNGTIFRLIPDGALAILERLHAKDGAGSNPSGTLAQDLNGNLYGTDGAGGDMSVSGVCAIATGYGVIYKITPSGDYTTFHVFNGADGACPSAGLVLGPDGNFYGTTSIGGENNYGTVFQITPDGGFKSLSALMGRTAITPPASSWARTATSTGPPLGEGPASTSK